MQNISIFPHQTKEIPQCMEGETRVVILQGRAKVFLEKDIYVLDGNETVLIPPNTECKIENNEESLLEMVCIQVKGAFQLC